MIDIEITYTPKGPVVPEVVEEIIGESTDFNFNGIAMRGIIKDAKWSGEYLTITFTGVEARPVI